MNFELANRENLTSLYNDIGNDCTEFELIRDSFFYSVQPNNGCWPNFIWDISKDDESGSIGAQVLNFYTNQINKPIIISNGDLNLELFLKKNSFVIVDQWRGMYKLLDYKIVVDDPKSGAYEIRVIDSNLSHWVDFVSSELFKGQRVSQSIFDRLRERGNKLIGIYDKNNKIIGCAFIYFDSNNFGSFYMVCVNLQHRGLGLGKLLVNYGLRMMQDRGVMVALLQSTRAGYKLYKSTGFIESNIYNLLVIK